MIQSPEVDSFAELIEVIKVRRQSEMFFRIDVKPPFSDTPEDWEDRLEAAFT
ncbi:sulfur relay protein DsrC [Sedimenticola hydrogenitrophicus]|uniref:sulfur relay protein DsrC n=1 Tax=Sedimenticola hydrogenitrophicus TaxID=2967975 RepID=UPI002FFB0AD5